MVLLDAALAALRDDEAAGVQPALQKRVELGGVELVARPALQGIVQVHDDDVELEVATLQPGLGVIDDELQARVVEGRVVLLQVLAAKSHHIPVNVDHHALLHALVPQHLARSAALAATADVDGLGARGVHQHRRMHEALVVDVLIHAATLNEAIDDESPAKGLEVDQVHGLELGGRGGQDLLDLVTDAEARLNALLQPLRHGG
mmetsp:Transcript_28466/g.71984  ORF Transcript_28466/g.71984 Transcript_28466/m.71984 type:complete len:204 (-) Transcript_28466:75-686(-)